MRVRDLCKLTVDWLIETGALESYQESGRFATSLGGRGLSRWTVTSNS